MNFDELEALLRHTFEDRHLSRSERQAVQQVLADIGDNEDHLRFVRNRAFEIAQSVTAKRSVSDILGWLEAIIRAIDNERPQPVASQAAVFFSPGDACREAIIRQITTSQQSIDVCVFTVTDNRISGPLLAAHRNYVKVRIITDDDKAHDRGSDIFHLFKMGVPVVTDAGPDHMHHKFAIFDQRVVLNGSFNWTRSASDHNFENIVRTADPVVVQAFLDEFNTLWGQLPRMIS